MTWNTDNSSGIVKLKTNNSKRKLNETHVRDVFEDLEEVDIYDCLAGETFEIKIAAIAERILFQYQTLTLGYFRARL